MKITEIKRIMTKKAKKQKPLEFVSTGSTLLNLACSGRARGGYAKGYYYFVVGDSQSGKTFYSLTCLAEAALLKSFDKYRFIFDNHEDGALMDIRKFFGKAVEERIEPPAVDEKGKPVFSERIEDFYYNLDDAVKEGTPFIYILDSMDSLGSRYADKKFDEAKKGHRAGTKVKGDYGDGKAKINSNTLRKFITPLGRMDSILIILSQTRANIGANAMFTPKIHSGGHALPFYATLQIWTTVKEKITRQVRGKKRNIGVITRARVKKNRMTGQDHSVDVPFYHTVGFDDIGSMVQYLVSEGGWKRTSAGINAVDFKFKGSEKELIEMIEEKGLYSKLQNIVESVWLDIQDACKVERKSRYE